MKFLIIHTRYRFQGGEDSVVVAEKKLLEDSRHTVSLLSFENSYNKIKALWLFFISFFNAISYLTVIKAIKEFHPDVIHVHNWYFAASPAVFIAAHRMNIPVVYTLHNYRLLCPSAILLHNGHIFENSLYQSFPWSAIKKKVYRNSYFQTFWLGFIVWFHQKMGTWSKVDKYIVLTEFSRQIYLKSKLSIQPEKLIVKPNFVCKTGENASERNDSFLFIGRLSEEKGIQYLLDVFMKNGLSLKIGGDGVLLNSVKEVHEQHPNIQYLGNLSHREVAQNMQECSALIFPSIWYETFGLVVIEAFSLGLPVIAGNLGSMSSLIRDGYNGLLFEAGNPFDLQAKIAEWQHKSQEEKAQFSKNAYQTYLDYYTPEQNLAQLVSIYNSVKK
ncbi:glycosyltransferase family 4 protein [Candidatus Symbiothrix dinenymphae]|uniref:glycosyltransferase family 4 protein n=1 Tax=Candidatus Symbiothrix dinenymphae TaxID=467085 RepID=UPI0006C30DAC|nr:glycosyltransferase family 4 protein [Candidatus Symbiothrix dinenymphae]GAP72520.1 glycosyl transferases group 1 [Candidatus Symbiothrix dinenymphae]